MKTIVKVLEIKKAERTGFSMFHGEGDAVKGTEIIFKVISGSGMLYSEHNEAVAIAGRVLSFWWPMGEAEALYCLQQAAQTNNYMEVICKSEWAATTNYGRGKTEVFDNKQEAEAFALNCWECVKRHDVFSEAICTD